MDSLWEKPSLMRRVFEYIFKWATFAANGRGVETGATAVIILLLAVHMALLAISLCVLILALFCL